jgi:predicted PurR-regulated permease PerM
MAASDLRSRQVHASAEWATLRARLRTVTPQQLGRAALTAVVFVGAAWLAAATWPAFLPFVVGGLIAYGLLPVVDALDKFMPRWIAALVAVLGAVATVAAIAIVVLPPLALGFVRFASDLPTAADIDAAVQRLEAQLGNLPEGSAAVLIPVLGSIGSTVHDAFANASGSLDDIVREGIRVALNAVGALLGLIVLPAWMLMVLNEKERARLAAEQRITPGLRQDVFAVAAIFDRAAGAYLRGYVLASALIGLLTYIGLMASPQLGGPSFSEPAALSVFAGAVQVIPVLGPFLGLLPVLLILPLAPERALVYLGIYLLARFIGGSLLGARLMERRLGVHPAILVPGVVLVSQFGLIWLLLSAPIVAIANDLVRYIHGRLSEPPQPAGLLPRTADGASNPASHRVPATYRTLPAPPPLTQPSSQSAAPPRAL